MINTATRRFASKKASIGTDRIYSYDKSGLDNARRRLDVALVEEAMKAMLEPEQDYYRVWDDYSDDEGDYLSWAASL